MTEPETQPRGDKGNIPEELHHPDEAVRKWQETPSENPRYKGATPADVGRALLRKSAQKEEPTESPPTIKQK